jgi:hypothetical protein
VRLVVDAPAGGQQILEPAPALERLAGVAGPLEERLVDPDDETVRIGGQVPAGRVLVEVERALLE